MKNAPTECITCKNIFDCKIENKNKGSCLNYESRSAELEEGNDNFGREGLDKTTQKSP